MGLSGVADENVAYPGSFVLDREARRSDGVQNLGCEEVLRSLMKLSVGQILLYA